MKRLLCVLLAIVLACCLPCYAEEDSVGEKDVRSVDEAGDTENEDPYYAFLVNTPEGYRSELTYTANYYLPEYFQNTVDSQDYEDDVYYVGDRYLVEDGLGIAPCLVDVDCYDCSDSVELSEISENDLLQSISDKLIAETMDEGDHEVLADYCDAINDHPMRRIILRRKSNYRVNEYVCAGTTVVAISFVFHETTMSKARMDMVNTVFDSLTFDEDLGY